MNWQKVVKLLRDIFTYAEVQILLYTLEEQEVHAMSAEGNVEFFVDDENLLKNRELETDFTKDSKTCQPTCDKQFPVLREKITTVDSLAIIFKISQRNSQTTLKNSTSSTQTLQTTKRYS